MSAEHPMNEAERVVWRAINGLAGFFADMREKGIHLGYDGRCVTCDQAWPCKASRERRCRR